jgi:REP element-mobilizing transposase RayT
MTGNRGRANLRLPIRKSPRLRSYGYASPGAYFVTVCTHDRRPLFGEVRHGIMGLNEFGSAVWKAWAALPARFPSIESDWFVVMPNHLHAVIVLLTPAEQVKSKAGPTLGGVVGALKSLGHKGIRDLGEGLYPRVWQERYHEHVVRDEDELRRIRKYIAENPLKWEFDRENPTCVEPAPAEAWDEAEDSASGNNDERQQKQRGQG